MTLLYYLAVRWSFQCLEHNIHYESFFHFLNIIDQNRSIKWEDYGPGSHHCVLLCNIIYTNRLSLNSNIHTVVYYLLINEGCILM